MFGIQLDRFHDQVDLVGRVHFSCDTVHCVVCDLERFIEVVKPIGTLSVVVFHDENNTGAVFRPRDEG